MNEEDRRVVSSKLESQDDCEMNTSDEDNRIRDKTKQSAEQSPIKTCRMDAAENRASQQQSQGYNSTSNHLQASNTFNSCVSEDTSGIPVHKLDSECSTTQAETSKYPG
ncbi:uncharacterized protein LOC120198016 isoform X2 [Hibiscus syriacus]|uniref:uncharacterized protein LOC120198016 isoform X2 n=1 Tax=Hibiscus syriacus TaxID=106335 RepID=UPI0019203CF0|nr:uncharacterized protein LOC120198016 isoform X2 [Hibiscus syriacus]